MERVLPANQLTGWRFAGTTPSARARALRGRAALVALAAGSLLAPAHAHAQGATLGRTASQHGAWSVVCDEPPGATREQCGALQSVVSEARPDLGLTVFLFETADGAARVLRVIAPLNIFLPEGLGLSIDGEDQGRAVFVRCVREGCQAEVVLDEAMLGKLRDGAEATFVIHQTPEEGTGFPVDLTGLTAALAEVLPE